MNSPLLFNADCLDAMWFIADGSVDLILCDLPYGTTACKWDVVIPFEPLWAHYKRLIKPNGAIVLFGKQPFFADLVKSNAEWFKCEVVWEKSLTTNFMNASHEVLQCHENIAIFYSRRPTYNPQMFQGQPYTDVRKSVDRTSSMPVGVKAKKVPIINAGTRFPRSVIKFSNPNHDNRHPTQKPVALCEYLIRTYTNEGETVLDNTMGSGSTGVACKNTNRKFIGIERDPACFAIAQQRIEGTL